MPYIRPPDFSPIIPSLTGAPGGPQVGATQLVYGTNVFTTIASAGDSAILPAATGGGRVCTVVNNSANVMHVFPAVGQQIVGFAVDGFDSPGVSKTHIYIDIGAGLWSGPFAS